MGGGETKNMYIMKILNFLFCFILNLLKGAKSGLFVINSFHFLNGIIIPQYCNKYVHIWTS